MNIYKAKLQDDDRLLDSKIIELIKNRKTEAKELDEYKAYFEAENVEILKKTDGVKIPVPYGRTLPTITVGFMYKPGMITYSLTPEQKDAEKEYLGKVLENFKANKEPQLNSELGKDQVVYGEAYEIHYIDQDGEENFAKAKPQEFVPVYDYSIKPKLIAGIRFYTVTEGDETTTEVDVYYEDVVQYFALTDETLTERDPEQLHPYGRVPVAIFKNNEEGLSDIKIIKPLIDAYDDLLSTYSDDEKKFADAILMIFGRVLDEADEDKLERLRVIDDLDPDTDKLEYLTKDSTQSARLALIETLRQEIYRQSFVPDMTDPSVLGQKSGEAFQYLFALFELLASVKEGYFAQGIEDRIQLSTMGVFNPNGAGKDPNVIQVSFTRNLPKDNVMWSGIVVSLWGMLPADALVPLLPFVKDPEGLIKAMEEDEATTADNMTAADVLKLYQEKLKLEEGTSVEAV